MAAEFGSDRAPGGIGVFQKLDGEYSRGGADWLDWVKADSVRPNNRIATSAVIPITRPPPRQV
jgi:hypothetical protein